MFNGCGTAHHVEKGMYCSPVILWRKKNLNPKIIAKNYFLIYLIHNTTQSNNIIILEGETFDVQRNWQLNWAVQQSN